MAFLNDPAWIAVIIAVLAIIVAILIARKQSNRKEVSYAIISNTLVLSIKEDIVGRVQV